nr:RNA-directed DNA polymerase, eukaryota, reverse transcriptase zinc-binding domain protein [Tanacetum cinerariifolium]
IIIKGQIHWICVKELEAWMLKFNTKTEDDTYLKEESEGNNENDLGGKAVNSEDPFRIYKILKRNKDTSGSEGDTPQYPQGFTPVDEENVVGNNPGNASQPNPTKSGNNEKAQSNKDICNHGTWITSSTKLLIISVYALHDLTEKRMLQDFIRHLIDSWDGECILLGTWITSSTKLLIISVYALHDFTEKRMLQDFIHHLIDSWDGECILLGYSFTWAHEFASKMSKLDRFLISEELVSDVQSSFVSNREIVDGSFILNELLSWCKHKNTKALIFKIDFEKAFNLMRCDYLDVVLNNFGFGLKWRSWIQGCLNYAMGSILVNGSLTLEFKFSKGLKYGDPLPPFLFILIMESLHLSFNNVVNVGLYNGIHIDDSLSLSHLFYADDVIFIASKKNGGLGVSSFFAFSCALLFKWILRFIANGSTLWSRFITAISSVRRAFDNPPFYSRRSPSLDIVSEVRKLFNKGIDLLSLVKKKSGEFVDVESTSHLLFSCQLARQLLLKIVR